jgi:hypothetical protein
MARDYEIDYDKLQASYDEALDQADAKIMRMGLHQMERPTNSKGDFADLPPLPEDLSELSMQQLSSLMGRLTTWYGYALGQQADSQCQRNKTEEQCKSAWAKLRRLKDGTVADKDDAVRTDTRFVGVNAALFTDESVLIKLRSIVESLKRGIESVSRAMMAYESRLNVEGRGAAAARKQGSEHAKESFRTGNRSALDRFRKRG